MQTQRAFIQIHFIYHLTKLKQRVTIKISKADIHLRLTYLSDLIFTWDWRTIIRCKSTRSTSVKTSKRSCNFVNFSPKILQGVCQILNTDFPDFFLVFANFLPFPLVSILNFPRFAFYKKFPSTPLTSPTFYLNSLTFPGISIFPNFSPTSLTLQTCCKSKLETKNNLQILIRHIFLSKIHPKYVQTFTMAS